MDLGFHQSHLFVLWFVKLFSHTHTSLFSLPYKDFSTFVEKFFLEVHATYLWPSWCRNRLSNCSFIQHIFTEHLLCVRYIIPAFKDPAVSCDTWNNCTRTIKTGYLHYCFPPWIPPVLWQVTSTLAQTTQPDYPEYPYF